jgi:type IV pilus assembly protein PilA
MKKQQSGFTLIELMIVVAIIGILAAIALPAYQDYTNRARMSEVILAASACRTSISEVYQTGTAAPGENNWGCEFTEDEGGTQFVKSIATDADGVVSVTATGFDNNLIDDKVVTLIPMIGGVPAVAANVGSSQVSSWVCGGTGTTVDTKFLPGSCRGAAAAAGGGGADGGGADGGADGR